MQGVIRDARRVAGRRFLVLSLLTLIALTAIRVADPQPVVELRNEWFDGLQRLSPREAQTLPVRVVDIDEASLAALGQWPWPRDLHADLVSRLWDLGAAVIAFDVLFAEDDRMSPLRIVEEMERRGLPTAGFEGADVAALDNDARFAEVMSRTDVVLGTAFVAASDAPAVVPKAGFVDIGDFPSDGLYEVRSTTPVIDPLWAEARGIGIVSVQPDRDDATTRTVPLAWRTEAGTMPALSLEALRVALGETTVLIEGPSDVPGLVAGLRLGDFQVPTTVDGQIILHLRPDDPALYVSAGDVLSGTLDAQAAAGLNGAIVFVGTSAAGLLDIHRTPLRQDVPGVSIHAQIVEQILTGEFLTRSAMVALSEIALLVALCVLLFASFVLAGPVTSFLCGGISTFGTILASWILFSRHGVLFDATFPLAAGLVMFTVMTAWQFLVADREKRKIRKSFARYVSDDVLTDMERRDHRLELGGVSRQATVMFCDVRGFTPLSETMTPAELVALLNGMFTALGDEILGQRGTIDKFIGDAIMAFWNAPLDQPDHARRAVLAALGMREALRRFNASREGAQIGLAIGLASGEVLVGNIGSRDRFNYSAIGETVNLASRIETACRHVDFDLLTTAATREAAGDIAALEAGSLALKGVSKAVETFVIVGDDRLAASEGFATLERSHAALLDAIRAGRDIAEALAACRAQAVEIAPGLDAFYRRLPQRLEDFDTSARLDTAV